MGSLCVHGLGGCRLPHSMWGLSSLTRAQACILCIGRRSLNHWTTRDAPHFLYYQLMVPHSSTLAWKVPWTEEPGRLQSMGSLRVRHDWAPSLSLSCSGEGNGTPLQCSCLENPRDGGSRWAAVYGVAQSRTRLKRLSSSSCRCYLSWGRPWELCSRWQPVSLTLDFPCPNLLLLFSQCFHF